MAELGEVKRGFDIGRNGYHKWCYLPCPSCGKPRWIPIPALLKNPKSVCKRCSGRRLNIKLAERSGKPLSYLSDSVLVASGGMLNVPCPDCGKPRLVDPTRYSPAHFGKRCQDCAAKHKPSRIGANSTSWKGGKQLTKDGYIVVSLHPGDPFFDMASKSGRSYRVLEHRLIMAQQLGRSLFEWEVVHHRGTLYSEASFENRSDNRLENLELLPGDAPNTMYARVAAEMTTLKEENRKHTEQIAELEKQVRLLRWLTHILQHGNVEPIPANEQKESSRAGVETRREEVQPINANSAPHPIEGDDIVQST